MNPGRQMDALVATKVMGIEPCQCTDLDWSQYQRNYGYGSLRFLHNNQCPMCNNYRLDYYSTNMQAALTLIEKVPHSQFKLEHDTNYGASLQTGWGVTIDGSVLVQFIESAPLAVSLASLKLKGVDVGV